MERERNGERGRGGGGETEDSHVLLSVPLRYEESLGPPVPDAGWDR